MPCQDQEGISANSMVTSSMQKQNNTTEHNGQEICPPFCTCTCCSVSRDFIQPKVYGIIIHSLRTQYAEYQTPAIAEQSLEIYQPPQIA